MPTRKNERSAAPDRLRSIRENDPVRKKQKDQLALVHYGKNSALGPIQATPGGWGLRNPESKGPGQRSAFFSQFSRAFGWRKWGGIMILTNDRVTVRFSAENG